ncbi:MAG: AmmeMemoRadiSam system radical SAM enzyme [Myxococcales bacterium]|nr:AmmeMemoRadiSam system radical SAM enzyme [Myxococcales bacterium]
MVDKTNAQRTETERGVRARWWHKLADGRLECTLCPRYCHMADGQHGFCLIRENHNGTLIQTAWGRTSGFAIDPIEKKPLNHFLPGTKVLSFGTAGCNLACKFCQNWSISKARLSLVAADAVTPEDIAMAALENGCPSVAYTYNDPTIFGEFVIDVARATRAVGVRNVMVTAGYITKEAREDIYPWIDAANVDLKGFSEEFYRKMTLSELAPVKETIRWLVKETPVWVELTTLLIPGKNDSPDELERMTDWILSELGPDVPIHFTAFHPDFKLTDLPRTPKSTLTLARNIAMRKGIRYVYTGNVVDPEGGTTYCSGCGQAVITRNWHRIGTMNLHGNKCAGCETVLPGVFDDSFGSTGHEVIRPHRVTVSHPPRTPRF